MAFRYYIFFCLFLIFSDIYSQNLNELSLFDLIDYAKSKSIPTYQAKNKKQTKYWEYKNYLANYKPQLILEGVLPSYTKSFKEVTQPDGNLSFESVYYNSSSIQLNLKQNIAATGGTLFLNSELQRFDNFSNNSKQYNGKLISIGFDQPLFQYNILKWDNLIEPLKYEESKKEYIEEVENISYVISTLYFDVLLNQESLKITKTNLTNTQEIFNIAKTKLKLGEISKNEILKLKLELLKSKNLLMKIKRDLEISKLSLKSYVDIDDDNTFGIPFPKYLKELPKDLLLKQAAFNRSKMVTFKRMLLEGKRDIAKARSDNGLRVELKANLGFSNTATSFNNLYSNSQQNQSLQLSFYLPILDWGRSKSKVKAAIANEAIIKRTVEQEEQSFKREVYTEITLFNLIVTQIDNIIKADKIAEEKYEIAKNTYKLGNISVTELSIAFSERFQAKKDFIETIGNYWKSYYLIRMLTLYDFENNLKISNN